MSSWALTSWTWVESGAIFSGDMQSGKVPLVPRWFQTKHDSSLGTKVRCTDVGTDNSAASCARALMVQNRWPGRNGEAGVYREPPRHAASRHPCPTAVWPRRESPLSQLALSAAPTRPSPPGAPCPNFTSLQLMPGPPRPDFQIRSTSQHGKRMTGPSVCPLCLSRCRETPRGRGLGSLSSR